MPGKNKKLFEFTADLLKESPLDVVVSSDDQEILESAQAYGFFGILRPAALSGDNADMIGVLEHAVKSCVMNPDDILVLLYLTYPKRTREDIDRAVSLFISGRHKSLLCKKEVKTHPYMCIYMNGDPVINHDFYRRQDYPECFEINHYIAIFRVSEIANLNKQLFNKESFFMMIEDKLDVDTIEDFNKIGRG